MKYAGPVLRSAQTIIAGSSTCTFHPIRLLQSPCDRLRTCPQPRSRRNVRYNSTTSATASTSPKASSASAAIPHAHPAFEDLATGLSRVQPCFGARGDEIELIGSPSEFYQTLLKMIGRARRRIIISSLYIGAEEETLVDAIQNALKTRPHLRVTFMLDYHRATRLSTSSEHPPSTAHLLLPLLEKHSDRCEVWLYRSPRLRGIMEKIVPERYDEGWGTWHGKWYGVDDEVVISGANLAQSYFTNRQDRYIHFRSHPTLLSYLFSLTRLFTHYAYLLSPSPPPSISRQHLVPLPSPPSFTFFGSAALVWPTPSIHPRGFSTHALATLTAFQNAWKASNASRLRRVDVDTWFWPVVQAGVLGVREEEAALAKVWDAVAKVYTTPGEEDTVSVDLTSGYFGLYSQYKRAVIDSPAPFRIIAASPKANGFYGSVGLSRLIPEGYTLLESRFWRDAQKKGRAWQATTESGVRLKEWGKEGWTYHAKGIWLSPSKNPSQPFMTFIGSSNLSTRSLALDTELSLLLATSSPSLRRALGDEIRQLDKNAIQVGEETWSSPERRVSWLATILVMLGVENML